MPPISYSPHPAFAALTGVLCLAFLVVALRDAQSHKGRRTVALSLALAAVFAVATGGLAYASIQQYVRMNTWTYFYRLDVHPNATSPEVVTVPIPEDASLLAGLHLVSGIANWSFANTVHGRGLYVRFSGPATVESIFSEFAPSGPISKTSLTMTNSVAFPTVVWIFYSGGGATLHFQPGGLVINGEPVVVVGWNLYNLLPPPAPPP